MANFGIDLLLESQKGNIKNSNDVLVILMHWILCAKNDLRNVGVGDNKIYSDEDRASELLPEGWNESGTQYALRYTHNKQIYLLIGTVTDDSLLINLLDAKSLKTASLVFDIKSIVKSKTGATLNDFLVDSDAVIKRITDEIVKPILSKPEEKKNESEGTSNPLLVQPPQRAPPHYYDARHNPYMVRDPLRDIGRGDLDPFGRGGGMIFQPDMPGRPGGVGPLGQGPFNPRPPGVPPGARYDPPNPFNRLNPDNDHLPPPGYDDMFM